MPEKRRVPQLRRKRPDERELDADGLAMATNWDRVADPGDFDVQAAEEAPTGLRLVIETPFGIGLGGPGSGHWAHRGRPGRVGGSLPREAGMMIRSGRTWLARYRAVAGRPHPYEEEIAAWRSEQKARGRPRDGAEAARRVAALAGERDAEIARLDRAIEAAKDRRAELGARVKELGEYYRRAGKSTLESYKELAFAKLWKQYDETCKEVQGLLEEKHALFTSYAQAARDLLFLDSDTPGLVLQPKVVGFGRDDPRRAAIVEGLAFVQRVVSGELELEAGTVVFRKGGRGRSRYADALFLTTHARAPTVVHELGHWIEEHCAQIRRRVFSFYQERTAGETLVGMNQAAKTRGYRSDEVTRVDRFIHPYMGKEYATGGRRYATEILSMGLEYFYADPVELAAKDPAYFAFIYDIVRGN